MNENPLITNLLDHIKALQREALTLHTLPVAQKMVLHLDRAVQQWDSAGGVKRPLHIGLLGGTGVGKSHLFNALLGQAELSPTSEARRGFTTVPYIAVTPAEKPLVDLPQQPPPVFLDTGFPGVVLCDTPDVDSLLLEHWQTTRALIERCDIVVYVTDPDRRASFRITEEIYAWAQQKRWFFVLNKMDLYSAEFAAIASDFDKRLEELGFTPRPETRFLVSAQHLERFDGPRLRQTLLQARPEEQRVLLRLDGLARYTQFAVAEALHGLEDKRRALVEREAVLLNRLHQAYCDGLRTPAASTAFRLVVREATWRYLGQRCGWFMSWPVWLRCHVSMLWTGYQLSRLLLKGVSIFGLLGVALSTVTAALRGVVPLQHIIASLGPAYRQKIMEIQQEARWIIEDHGLAAWGDAAETLVLSSTSATEAWVSTASKVPAVGNLLENALRQLLPSSDDEVLAQLQADVEHSGSQIAYVCTSGIARRGVLFLANLIPASMLGWILYRLSAAWWVHEYLPWPFYGMAFTLFLGSFLPGFMLLSWQVHARVTQVEAAHLVSQVDSPSARTPLRLVVQRLGQFMAKAQRLGQLMRETQHTLGHEGGLTSASFGTVFQEDRTPRV